MDHVNPDRLMKVLSEILSEKYDMKITLTAHRKTQQEDANTIHTSINEEKVMPFASGAN